MTNQDAPDRIWIEEDDGCPYFYDASELAEAGGPLIEYLRADIATPAPVWREFGSELSGNTGELVDKVAEAIRGDTTCDDTPWAVLSEDRKIGWRGDAERALAAVKEYLTAHTPAPVVPADGLRRASAEEASAGWTLDFEMLKDLRAAAGDWGYSLYLEAVEQIALAVEARLRSAPPVSARVTWIATADRLPEKPGKRSYEQIECLIKLPNGDIEVSMWNCEHLCWDDADGDDFRFDPGQPSHWMPLAPIRAALLPAGEGE